MDVVVFGDSIAIGDGASRPSASWVNLWAAAQDEPVRLIYFTIGGGASGGGLQYVRDKCHVSSDLAIIAFGINDANLIGRRKRICIPPDRYALNLHEMVELLDRPTLLVSPIEPNPKWEHASGRIEEYRLAVERVARSRGCFFADATTAWRARGSVGMFENGINHPDDDGHRVIGEVCIAATAELSSRLCGSP